MKNKGHDCADLPLVVQDYIELVVRKVRYRRVVRNEVRAELAGHFRDALAGCEVETEREERARELIAGFGDVKVLANLIRRGKKRCRAWWRTVIVRMFQVVGVILLLIVLRAASLSIGTVNISVDYLEKLKQLNSQGYSPEDNAFRCYQEAARILNEARSEVIDDIVDFDWPDELDTENVEDWTAFLQKSEAGFELLTEGARRPYYFCSREEYGVDFPLPQSLFFTSDYQPLLNTLFFMDSMGDNRYLAKAMTARGKWRIHNGDIEGGFSDLLMVYRLGGHLTGKHFLIEQLTGLAIVELVDNAVKEALSQNTFSSEVLQWVQEEIKRSSKSIEFEIDFDAERFIHLDFVQSSFTDSGDGTGRPLRGGGIVASVGGVGDFLKYFMTGFPGRSEVVGQINKCYNLLDELGDDYAVDKRGAVKEKFSRIHELAKGSFMLSLSMPAFEKTTTLSLQSRAGNESVCVLLSLARYKLENNEYPDALSELVKGGYIDFIPKDPFALGELSYRRTGDGFVLYSYGEDSDDDGGVETEDDRWGGKKGGDRVFWPVTKK